MPFDGPTRGKYAAARPSAGTDGQAVEAGVNDVGEFVPPSRQDVSLQASTTETATGVGTAVSGLRYYSYATIMLDVTADATDAADTLDVLIQRLLPDGTTWDTIGRFTQHLGNGTPDKYVMDITAASGGSERAADDDVTTLGNVVLAAGDTRDVPWGDQMRVAWIIVDADCDASFTFSVTGHFRV
jgi:hypothetical protein